MANFKGDLMHVFCFNMVGLSPELLEKLIQMPGFSKLMEKGVKTDMEPVFPCLTLPGQATFSTGSWPEDHGIVANGFYYRDRFEVSFWDQYRSLVGAIPFWESIKQIQPDYKSAVLFCQNTLYSGADFIITPKPMHTDEGLVQWCYSKPPGLYEQVCEDLGQPFNLMDYWGPFASHKASDWIMGAAINVMENHRPELMVTYLPHLDYSCQKFGSDDPAVSEDLEHVDALLGKFVRRLETAGLVDNAVIAIFSEYGLSRVKGAVLPNRLLRENGFLAVRDINNREYLDIENSRAFAMVDHQVAHIYVKNSRDTETVQQLLEAADGVQMVMDTVKKAEFKIDHARSGELIAVSDADKWFAYYWWDDPAKAPDFAFNIDIHRKPGYDPLELFMDMKTRQIPLTTELIKGSHGAPPTGPDTQPVFILTGNADHPVSLTGQIKMTDVSSVFKTILAS